MTASWDEVSRLFDQALSQPEVEREEWIRQVCGDDHELRRQLDSLLEGHGFSGILDRSVDDLLDGIGETTPNEKMPEEVGPYRVLEPLGHGGMGVVYRAYDPRLHRHVAIKLLPAHLGRDAAARSRLMAEARAASALDHPNICTIHDIGETDAGEIYLALSCYDGQTVAALLEGGRLSLARAVSIAQQTARGLAHAHASGVIHRDIKPSNLFLTEDGTVKILDFGIASRSSDETTPEKLLGTPRYMSPEQASRRSVDGRTDLWSLGVVLWEMLTGEPTFPGDEPWAVLQSVVHEDAPSARSLRPEVSAGLDRIVSRLLSKDPGQRFARAEDVVRALDGVANGPAERAELRTRVSLPRPRTTFVGREREARQVVDLLGVARLVTLTGPAGTGKTRLALEAGRQIAQNGPGGEVAFVPLAALDDDALVMDAIAHALMVVDTSDRSLLDAVAGQIGTRPMILILDNFEQVVAAAAGVAALLDRCQGLRVLATSRVALRVEGEHEFQVEPLALPAPDVGDWTDLASYPAMQLFLHRARAVVPGFDITPDNAPSIADLCRCLDGLPLAIELAAARIKMFSPRALASRLSEHLDLLKDGLRDRPARHQTLRQAIAWSADLLSPDERAVFRRASAFVGGFNLASLTALCSAAAPVDADPIDALTALVDHSLVRAVDGGDVGPRFVLLETIRAFAASDLEAAGETSEIREAHGDYFAALTTQAEVELVGPDQAAWLDRLDADRGNLRAAQTWAEETGNEALALKMGASLWRFWLARGYLKEGRTRLERSLAASKASADRLLRARALQGLGTLAHNEGRNNDSRQLLEESLALYRKEEDVAGTVAVLNGLGWVGCEIGDFRLAQELSNEGLALARRQGDSRGVAVALNNLGWIGNYRGHCEEALAHHRESLEIRRHLGDQRNIAFALASVSWALRDGGEYPAAREALGEARSILEPVADQLLQGFVFLMESALFHDRGDLSRARTTLTESERLWRESDNLSGQAWARTHSAAVSISEKDFERAHRELDEAKEDWSRVQSNWGLASVEAIRARLLAAQKEMPAARLSARASLALRIEMADARGIAECLLALATSWVSGEPDHAARCLGKCHVLWRRWSLQGSRFQRGEAEALERTLTAALGQERFSSRLDEGAGLDLGPLLDSLPDARQR